MECEAIAAGNRPNHRTKGPDWAQVLGAEVRYGAETVLVLEFHCDVSHDVVLEISSVVFGVATPAFRNARVSSSLASDSSSQIRNVAVSCAAKSIVAFGLRCVYRETSTDAVAFGGLPSGEEMELSAREIEVTVTDELVSSGGKENYGRSELAMRCDGLGKDSTGNGTENVYF